MLHATRWPTVNSTTNYVSNGASNAISAVSDDLLNSSSRLNFGKIFREINRNNTCLHFRERPLHNYICINEIFTQLILGVYPKTSEGQVSSKGKCSFFVFKIVKIQGSFKRKLIGLFPKKTTKQKKIWKKNPPNSRERSVARCRSSNWSRN